MKRLALLSLSVFVAALVTTCGSSAPAAELREVEVTRIVKEEMTVEVTREVELPKKPIKKAPRYELGE